jgi:DNA primase
MPFIEYSTLKSLISVPRALGLLGWRASEVTGNRYRGPCPIHGSTSPASRSFSVTTTEWYCHKCKKGGDVILLWQWVHRLEVYPAALHLCHAAGVDPPFHQPAAAATARPRRNREEAL